jgi:predicted nuclease of predicted toxin-antitoxin system
VRFLIDECLHTSLTDIAHKAGHEAYHVTRRGWTGLRDHQLRDLAIREELVFVTNNARDFRKLMGAVELHAGLIVIIPNATPAVQRELYERALHELVTLADMINKVVEVDLGQVSIYEVPKIM